MTQSEIKVGKKRVQKKGAAKVRHLGRRKAKIEMYYHKTYPLTKLRRILRCNGESAAKSWAMKNGAMAILESLLRRG